MKQIIKIKSFAKTTDQFIVNFNRIYRFRFVNNRLYTKLVGYTTKGIIHEINKRRKVINDEDFNK